MLATQPQPKPIRQGAALALTSLFLLVIVTGFLASLYSLYSLRVRFAEVRAEYQQLEGKLPGISASEWVENRYRETTSTEGTVAWSKIVVLCEKAMPPLASRVPVVGEGAMPTLGISGSQIWPNINLTEQFLKQMRPVLELIRQSRDVEQPVWFSMEHTGMNTLLPELQTGRSIARLVRLEALYALYHKDAARAMEAIRSLDSVVKVFDSHLFLVGELIHTALQGIHYETIQQSLRANVWSDEQLAELSAMISEPLDIQDRWEQSLLYERTLAMDSKLGVEAGMPTPILSPDVRLALLKEYDELLRLGKYPIEELSQRAAELERALNVDDRPANSGSQIYAAVRNMIFPAIESLARSFEISEYRRRATAIAIAIKQFERSRQRWPMDLRELQNSELIDSRWLTGPGTWDYQQFEEEATLLYVPRSKVAPEFFEPIHIKTEVKS